MNAARVDIEVPKSLVIGIAHQPMEGGDDAEAGWLMTCMGQGERQTLALRTLMAMAAIAIAVKQDMGHLITMARRIDIGLTIDVSGIGTTCRVFDGHQRVLGSTQAPKQESMYVDDGGPNLVRLGASPKSAQLEIAPSEWRALAMQHAKALQAGTLFNAAMGGNDAVMQTTARIGSLVTHGVSEGDTDLAAAVAWLLSQQSDGKWRKLLDDGGHDFKAMLLRDGPIWTAKWTIERRRRAA
ncbi:MAG: hypothetical protein RIM84_07880 [Alphaproteobacteria bacterium]